MQLYAKDIMSETLITLQPEMTLEEALDVFRLNDLTGAPVVDSRGVLVGVLTVRDILNAGKGIAQATDYFDEQGLLEEQLGEAGFHLEPTEGLVADYLKSHVYTAYPDTPVEALAKQLYQHHIHRMIVVKPNEQIPMGIVSTFDLLKVLAERSSTAELASGRRK